MSDSPEALGLLPGDAPPSLARNSMVRFLAEAAGVILAMVTGVITARWLGPAGKGTLSSLLFLAVLCTYVSALGLGEASITLVGQRRSSVQGAVSSSLGVLLMTGTGGLLLLGALAWLQLGTEFQSMRVAIALACLSVPVAAALTVLSGVMNATERIVLTSLVFGLSLLTTTLMTILLVAVFDLGVAGGVGAALAGSAAGLIILLRVLSKEGNSIRPRLDGSFIAPALRLGSVIQVSYLLIALTQRLDQLIVYSLAGGAAAGRYSVSLTLGQLVIYGPFALSLASYPRIAQLAPASAVELLEKVVRSALIAALVSGLELAAFLPFAIPFFFGSPYRSAIAPALILIIGNVLWSIQWVLARGAAARGRTGVLVAAFGSTLISMVGCDYLLVPRLGISGAALGSTIGSLMGLAVAVLLHRSASKTFRMSALIPRAADLREFREILVRSLQRASSLLRST